MIIAVLSGTDPNLPALLLNSHTDVVPAEDSKWNWKPFDAKAVLVGKEWRVYARGSQDMKSVGLQYIEALSQLWTEGWRPKRRIIISFVPDEEIGGVDGMKQFVNSRLFKNLNLGVALDEGLPKPDQAFNVYYGERKTWWLSIKVEGSPGHGATMPEHTSSGISSMIMERAQKFRKAQWEKLQDGLGLGEVTGVNLVYMQAGDISETHSSGFQMNIIPSVTRIGFDIRVPPNVPEEDMDKEIRSWMECQDGELCNGVSYEFHMKVLIDKTTSRQVKENPYYHLFINGMKEAGIEDRLVHGIFPAATDSRYVREKGLPCFGFSPIEKTPDLLHKHNEYITVAGYMKGISIYKMLIKNLAEPTPSPPPSQSPHETPVAQEEHEEHEIDAPGDEEKDNTDLSSLPEDKDSEEESDSPQPAAPSPASEEGEETVKTEL